MTTQQAKTIRDINAKDEAQRVNCELNSRPALTAEERELSVRIAVQVKIDEGNMEAARQLWRNYREGK